MALPAAVAAVAALALPVGAGAEEERREASERSRIADDLVAALDLDPANRVALEGLGKLAEACLEEGELGTGEFAAAKAALRAPESLEARLRHVRLLFARGLPPEGGRPGDRARAEKELRDLLLERPSATEARRLLVDTLEAAGRPREALEACGEWTRARPKDLEARVRRGDLLLWVLKDPPRVREEAGLRRALAAGATMEDAGWLRRTADALDAEAGRLEASRETLRAHERRLGWLLAGAVAAALGAAGICLRFLRPGAG